MNNLKKCILVIGLVAVFSISSAIIVFAGDEYDPLGDNSIYYPVKSISHFK